MALSSCLLRAVNAAGCRGPLFRTRLTLAVGQVMGKRSSGVLKSQDFLSVAAVGWNFVFDFEYSSEFFYEL